MIGFITVDPTVSSYSLRLIEGPGDFDRDVDLQRTARKSNGRMGADATPHADSSCPST